MSSETRNTEASRPDRALRWAGRILFVTALIVITDLALQPGYETPPRLLGSDKLEHLAAFGLLTALALQGWPRRPTWLLAGLLLTYGIAIEWLQGQPQIGRTASIGDLAADMAGIAMGLLVAHALQRWLGK